MFPLRPWRTLWFILFVLAMASGGAQVHAATTTRDLLVASGVHADRLDHYCRRLDELTAAAKVVVNNGDDDALAQARALHEFLHRHVLTGKYQASASDIGAALDGGPFNCAASSTLFATLAARLGLEVAVLSTPGHVWCRVGEVASGQWLVASEEGGLVVPSRFSSFSLHPSSFSFHVETTCRDWFAIQARYAGVATEDVSPAMAAHRRRVQDARALTAEQLVAIFHFNRGVTHLRQAEFGAALWANLKALSLDPQCRPAWENAGFAGAKLFERMQVKSER